MANAAAAVAAGHTTVHALAAPQRYCLGRHLAHRNETRVYGSDIYALLLVEIEKRGLFLRFFCFVSYVLSNNDTAFIL